ncbi:MAG: hypothetical protein AAB964_00145 [Patescibacteria group bacterium]
MRHIGDHMGGLPAGRQGDSPRSKRDKATERGEMMKYFMDRLNESRKRDGLPFLTMPRMGRLLVAIPTQDLYYLKSVCDQSKDFSKKFWWEINPKKHQP